MRIKSTDSQQPKWPLTVNCFKCGFDLEVSLPTDMKRVCYKGDPPEFKPYVQCPICGMTHDLKPEQIPEAIFKKIPVDSTMGIMAYHD